MSGDGFRVGEHRRHVSLGSEAIYRVCDWDRELVELEVVSAPGLTPGQRFRFTIDAARQMTIVEPGDEGEAPKAP